MKRHWRRLLLIGSTVLLTACLIVVGLAVWLYKSGRLATLSEQLLHRLSGQEVRIGAIEFPSWHTAAFINVHVQQPLSGWLLTVECPRLEVHYGLLGLLNQQVDAMHLQQPRVDMVRSDRAASAEPAPPAADAQSAVAVPVHRLSIEQGSLDLRWQDTVYALRQVDATIHPQNNRPWQIAAKGNLQDRAATFQLTGHTAFTTSRPTGRLHLTATAVPATLLTTILSHATLTTWHITQGTLDLDTNLDFQEHMARGTITITAQQMTAQVRDLTLRQGTLATEATLEADYTQHTLRLDSQTRLQAEHTTLASGLTLTQMSVTTAAHLEMGHTPQALRAEGQAQVQAARADAAPATSLTQISLTTPWHLSRTAEQWQVTVTPAFTSQAVAIGTRIRASGLSLRTSTPVQVQYNSRDMQVQGTPEVAVQTLEIRPGEQTETTWRLTDVQARLPLQGNTTTVDFTGVQAQTQAWYQQTAQDVQWLETLTVRGSGTVDLGEQRLTIREATVSLPQLGDLQGSGEWHWPSSTLHDPHVQVVSTAIDALQKRLSALLPTPYQSWAVAGHTNVHLRATHVSLHPPRQVRGLVIAWQIRDGAFSTPDSTYASEHVNATLQATASLDETSGQYAIQGTLTLQPFALLVGSLFPAIEAHHITTVVTFSGLYAAPTQQVEVYLASQFHTLGTITLQGAVHRPLASPHYDLQLHLRDVHLQSLWSTFMHDATSFPSLSQAVVQGRLNAGLHLQGSPTDLHLRGTVDMVDGYFETPMVSLRDMSFVLPVQAQYPLPTSVPQSPTAPAETYGRLSIEALRIGRVDVARLSVGLMVHSDNLLFQSGILVPLWGGQIALEHITAQHLLQPHRRVTLQARLRNLDLQRLPRGTTKLPLAGRIEGDFPRLYLHGDRLETQGAVTMHIAGGVVRLFDVQGSDLLSALPTVRCSLSTEQPLSLLRLTDIYPIGDIGGTVHFSVTDLTMTASEPAAFVLEFAVQEKGGETREITLRALNNLLFTTGSVQIAAGLIGEAYRLPYRRFGATITLQHDILRLRGKYHDRDGLEYFMQAPALGGGVEIVNRVPHNGIPFEDFLQRLKATILDKPDVQVQ